MSKRVKSKPTVSESESSEEEEIKPKKKAKQEKSSKATSSSKKDEEVGVFEIAAKRRVSVRKFKGKILVDIREFYEADGELRPGKKGISLKVEEWEKLKNLAGDIDEAIEQMA
ncbi:uncharacterized protein LOC144630053 [Oculina patagonica]